ncbi:uncharacterized protein AC631_00010 [Debaryomyces fabryi]|uniref:superoxide dismutase n=1 Tax=Debaryomyces fabryi TaxID=58627 RepID=A0A0V1Q6M5_9ASCO|nr:uncharacterized protein AC631_00010 [Debaryomyces fabryi]KSA04139.1 hypothetical protein AC631_00010 [Debaryomyces fabryi]CUM46195.1 unnamed protein product [Debaryomyces fabryi]
MVCSKKLLSLLAGCIVVMGESAPVVTDSPEGAKYVAKFDDKLQGSVEFSSASNGSVTVNVDLDGFPASGGPFTYHIHEAPVPSDGNCTGTKLHLNPYNGNPNATEPSELEVGDLSGRHGAVQGTSIDESFVDQYISLNENNKAFIGGLSVTIHYKNTSRLACANITEESSTTTPVATASENGANVVGGMGGIAAAAAVALGLLI